MDAKIRREWVEALRSGKYKQTRGRLRKDATHFCCLGVLCDIVAPGQWKRDLGEWKFQDRNNSPFPASLELPSVPFRKRVKLTLDAANKLAEMNDTGKRFSTIANYIEKNL